MTRTLTLALALLGLALAGCVSAGRDYKRPELAAPDSWANAQGPAEPAPGFEQAAWWKSFQDPVLGELIAKAAAANLDVAQARARVAQARADQAVSRAQALPQLNLAGSSASSYSNVDALATNGQSNTSQQVQTNTIYKGGFDVAWEIDVFGGLKRQREASLAALEASRENLRAVTLTLLSDVARYYTDLREHQQRLLIAHNAAASQQANAEVTRERFRIGLVSHLDVSQAQAQLAATQAAIPAYEATVAKSIHRLGVLLGQDPGSLTGLLAAPAPLPASGATRALGLPSELLSRRPDLRRLERLLAAAQANVGAATAKLYPSFDLTMGLGLQGNVMNAFLGLANWYWSVLPAVAAPVFDGGKARAGVAKQQAACDEALAAYRAAFLAALEEVENALVSIAAEERAGQNLAVAVTANEQALALARERYAKGLTSFLDVTAAEKSLFEAQQNAVASKAALLRNLITLAKALGGGWDCPELDYQRAAAP